MGVVTYASRANHQVRRVSTLAEAKLLVPLESMSLSRFAGILSSSLSCKGPRFSCSFSCASDGNSVVLDAVPYRLGVESREMTRSRGDEGSGGARDIDGGLGVGPLRVQSVVTSPAVRESFGCVLTTT